MRTTKLLCAGVFLFAVSVAVHAQIPDWNWAQKVGGTNPEESRQTIVDSSGNSYTIGNFSGTASFGSVSLTTAGLQDVYIVKMNSSGNVLWAIRAGGSNGDEIGVSIALDSAETSLYITGSFNSSTAYFGTTSLTRNSNSNDIFVAKLNTAGTFLWSRKAGGTSVDDAKGIVVNGTGNIYVTGAFKGSATFGSLAAITAVGYSDVFVAKINAGGNFEWVRQGGGTGIDSGYSIGVDATGNIYAGIGFASISVTFGTFTLTNSQTVGGTSDISIVKLDATGNWQWAKKAVGISSEQLNCLTCSDDGIILTGAYNYNCTFGTITLTSMGSNDVFVAKINTSGEWVWARKAGGSGNDVGWSVKSTSDGKTYVGGEFIGTATFGTYSITSSSTTASDAFVAMLDSDGNWQWVKKGGGTSTDACSSVCADNADNVYISGDFTGSAYFDGINLIANGSNSDVFIGKLSIPPLKLTSPIGGEAWVASTEHVITWNSWGVQQVMLEYNADADTTWTAINANPLDASMGAYYWTLPEISSDVVKVRISDYANPATQAISPAFEIYIPLTLLSPQGGEGVRYAYNTEHPILWDAELVAQVCLEYSLNAGNSWDSITNDPIPANVESYNWVIPYEFSEFTKVRVRDYANPDIAAESESVFVIYIPLVLQSLHGGPGIIYVGDSTQEIVWNSTFVSQVMLDYSLDGGTTWELITETPLQAGLGSFSWLLPNIDCDTAKVRVRDFENPQAFAISNEEFGIRRPLTQLSLLGGAGMEFRALENVNIEWASFSVQQVVLEYSLDSGITWQFITPDPVDATMGSYYWTLPNITVHSARIRISDYANPNTFVLSPGDFAIIIPPSPPADIEVGTDSEEPGNFELNWEAVLTDVNGTPLQPDGYRIYYSTVLSNDLADFTLLATVTDGTSFSHEGATEQLGKVFYKVVAFKN